MKNKIYIIWIWWIWISAIARYYNSIWWEVFASDSTDTELIKTLKKEWINIIIWEDEKRLEKFFSANTKEKLVIYTEAITDSQKEIKKAIDLNIKTLSYPKALSEIANSKKLISVAWTHGKSTTSSLLSLVFKNSDKSFYSIVWSLLKEFWLKNFYSQKNNICNWSINRDEYFIIEACEYKRAFINYKAFIAIIVNIELDHLDYYKDLDDYNSAFKQYLENVRVWWYAVLNWLDENCKKLVWLRKDINYIVINQKNYKIIKTSWEETIKKFPEIDMKIPGGHILFDAKIAYSIWEVLEIEKDTIIKSLESYKGIWRRMEILWESENKNIFMSDYAHHPTEIKLTLEAIKSKNLNKKIICIFQPHQYSRTIKLLDWFKNCFSSADKLIIPDIYKSRDSVEDMQNINTQKLLEKINHQNKLNWYWLDNTLKVIKLLDKESSWNIFILMWAWDVDDLRYKLDLKK